MSTAAISIIAAVGDQLDRIGAIAGLASVIGLGVMSMLYFAQAREVKRLREWAGRAPERSAELELRVQTDAQRRVSGQPLAPATTAAQQQAEATAALYAKLPPAPPPPAPLVAQVGQLARPGVPVATSSMPGAVSTPAPGSVAPAPVTATPAASPVPKPTPSPTPTPPPSPAAVSTAGATTQSPTPASTPTRVVAAAKPAPVKATAYPTAATASAAAAAAAAARQATPAPSLGNGSAEQHTQASAAARPSPPPAPPSRAPEQTYDDDGFSPGRLLSIIGGAVVVLVVAVALMLVLTDEEPTPPQNNIGGAATTPAPDAADDPGAPADEEPSGAASSNAVDRPATNVAVLNGTTQAGLARGVADKLETAKFTISTVGNNADQRVPQTIVSFTDGNERAANIVADAIGVDRGVVQPSDRNATVAAEADVVVTVGTDQIE